jgi:hypothetical protein
MYKNEITLVMFTCEGREHLILNTINSFKANCDISFNKILIAIDGNYNFSNLSFISPDSIIYFPKRNGYVNSINSTLKNIDTNYFFWLEDDWTFHQPLNLANKLNLLKNNDDWAEIVFSKYGALENEYKENPVNNNLYLSPFGFSANPCLCNTKHIKEAFNSMTCANKGSELGEDGFENYLTNFFAKRGIKCVIEDPQDGTVITHEGYLESTPREWHMTSSLEQKSDTYLAVFPKPSIITKIKTFIKLWAVLFILSIRQFYNRKVYDYCFRIIIAGQKIKKK